MDSLFLWCLYPPIEQQADISSNQQPVFSNLICTVRTLCLCYSVKSQHLFCSRCWFVWFNWLICTFAVKVIWMSCYTVIVNEIVQLCICLMHFGNCKLKGWGAESQERKRLKAFVFLLRFLAIWILEIFWGILIIQVHASYFNVLLYLSFIVCLNYISLPRYRPFI